MAILQKTKTCILILELWERENRLLPDTGIQAHNGHQDEALHRIQCCKWHPLHKLSVIILLDLFSVCDEYYALRPISIIFPKIITNERP